MEMEVLAGLYLLGHANLPFFLSAYQEKFSLAID
jgi:hypothetical protein